MYTHVNKYEVLTYIKWETTSWTYSTYFYVRLEKTGSQSGGSKVILSPIRHFTVCPGSSDPFYIASLLYKMGHYFLDIPYIDRNYIEWWYAALTISNVTKKIIKAFYK